MYFGDFSNHSMKLHFGVEVTRHAMLYSVSLTQCIFEGWWHLWHFNLFSPLAFILKVFGNGSHTYTFTLNLRGSRLTTHRQKLFYMARNLQIPITQPYYVVECHLVGTRGKSECMLKFQKLMRLNHIVKPSFNEVIRLEAEVIVIPWLHEFCCWKRVIPMKVRAVK